MCALSAVIRCISQNTFALTYRIYSNYNKSYVKKEQRAQVFCSSERFYWNMNWLCRFFAMHFYLISPLIRFQLVAPIAKYYHVDLYIRGACTLRQPYTFVVQHRRAITALTWTAYCTLNWFNWILVFAKHRTAFDASASTMIAQDVLPFLFFFAIIVSFFTGLVCFFFCTQKSSISPLLPPLCSRSLFHFKRSVFHPRQSCMFCCIKMLLYHQYHIAFCCIYAFDDMKKENRFLVSIYENESGELFVM